MGLAAKFIAFEGIDKSGKDTLCDRIKGWMEQRGITVVTGSEPNDHSPIGQYIRLILQQRRPPPDSPLEFQRLYVLDRTIDTVCTIQPALESGAAVLMVRFHLSTFAYGEGSPAALKELHHVVAGSFLRWPDLTIVVDISPEEAMRRLQREEGEPQYFETLERLGRARQRYIDLTHNTDLVGRVLLVNGERPPDEIFADVCRRLLSIFGEEE